MEWLIERLMEELRRLEERERELRSRLSELPAGGGTLDYRWVKNSQGRKYWYWYLVYYRNGRRCHKYLGKQLPSDILESRVNAREARRVARELRRLAEARARAERYIEKALSILQRVLQRV